MSDKSDSPNNNRLAFETTADLLAELATRFDCFIFGGYADRDKDTYRILYESSGSVPEILGLTRLTTLHIEAVATNSVKD